jgi:hypothetical protein
MRCKTKQEEDSRVRYTPKNFGVELRVSSHHVARKCSGRFTEVS